MAAAGYAMLWEFVVAPAKQAEFEGLTTREAALGEYAPAGDEPG